MFSKLSKILGFAFVVHFIAPATTGHAAVITLTTSQSQIQPGTDNHGWWSPVLVNTTTNPSYFTGEATFEGPVRSFFTFDLAGITERVTSATLRLSVHAANADPEGETLGIFDVSTDPVTLNNNTGVSESIFDDLGTGVQFASFDFTGDIRHTTIEISLNVAALTAINDARGDFFSVGGALTTIKPGFEPGDAEEFIFNSSHFGPGTRELILETSAVGPIAVSEPGTFATLGIGLTGLMLVERRRRRKLT